MKGPDHGAISNALVVILWDPVEIVVSDIKNIGIKEDRTIHTDAHGKYAVELPPGFYDIFVTASEFNPTCKKIRIKSESEITYSPKLKINKPAYDENSITVD